MDLRFEDIPEWVVTHAKAVIAHDLAIAAAGSDSDELGGAVRFARATGNSGRSSIVGHGGGLAPIDAAFANAVAIRALRQEDSILPSFIHPGPIVLPAALAVAEHDDLGGRDLLTAVVGAYEVLGALAGTDWTWETARRTPSHVFGAFGSAAAAAKLRSFDVGATMGAFAYAANAGAMITHGLDNHQYGVVGRNGMTAAELGLAGAPYREDIIEGRFGFFEAQAGGVPADLADRLASLGRVWHLSTAVLKPYPCTAINVVPIAILKRILKTAGIAGADVSRVVFRRSANATRIPMINAAPPWPSAGDRISSLVFHAVATLEQGGPGPDSHDDETLVAMAEQAGDRIVVESLATDDLMYHEVSVSTYEGDRFDDEGGAELLVPPDPISIVSDQYGRSDLVDRVAAALEMVGDLEGRPVRTLMGLMQDLGGSRTEGSR